MNLLKTIEDRARAVCPRIMFPESDEPRILEMACEAVTRGIARPILVGDEREIGALAAQHGISLEGVSVMPMDEALLDEYAENFSSEQPAVSWKMMRRKLKSPLYFAACMVHYNDADSFIAGYRHSTGDVILAASSMIGYAEGVSTISSFNLVTIPGFQGSEGENIIFTDVAVCVDPSAEKLAEIAMLAADAARRLIGWEPRVAFLSYSTKGSGESPFVEKVTNALEILHARRPDIVADGEFQLEVALSESAACKKLEEPGEVAGRANILVFPDIQAGNTNIKAVKLFAKANSIGPILTGFRKPVSDLSRTGSLEHLISTVSAVATLCGND
ncbi:MAG: phosphate acyltransferase [Saccharofermentanales bacterium]|jgi:phosphate acetyltransferase|nr:phosphate acetyl/butaryl transferase [Clostridiaceae bacterium]